MNAVLAGLGNPASLLKADSARLGHAWGKSLTIQAQRANATVIPFAGTFWSPQPRGLRGRTFILEDVRKGGEALTPDEKRLAIEMTSREKRKWWGCGDHRRAAKGDDDVPLGRRHRLDDAEAQRYGQKPCDSREGVTDR